MKKPIRHTVLVLLVIAIGCVEEFKPKTEVQAQTQELASALVVDGLLTDELKRHRVILTRTFSFEDEAPEPERQASVRIIDGQGAEYSFEEFGPGIYLSTTELAARADETYMLQITTSEGKDYRSSFVAMPPKVPIANLRAERMVNDIEEEGVGIFLDNTPDVAEPTYFRYEFVETYKIIAPKWDPFRLVVVRYEPCFPNPFEVAIETWEDEHRVCFASSTSNKTIQTSSVGLEKGTIENFQAHFLSRNNYIISHRYSINLTQYSQTQDAFSFYQRLSDFSSSDNVFSQIQPGFLEGNIMAENDPSEKVLGYFEVASVDSKRIYFNYADLFPGEPLPPYAVNCENFGNPRLIPRGYHCADVGVCDGNCQSPLIEAILAGLVTFAAEKENDVLSPYYTWPSPCGDCTKLGSNIVPEFWIEE